MARVLQWRRQIGLCIGLAILAVLAVVYEPATILRRLSAVDWQLALPAIFALSAIHLLQVETWRLLVLRLSGTTLRRSGASMVYYAGQAIGTLTPGNLGADFYRAFLHRGANEGWDGVLAPIVGQRVVSTLALLVLAAAAGIIRLLADRPIEATLLIALLWVAGWVLGTGGGGLARHRLRRVQSSIWSRLPPRLRSAFATDLSLFALPLLLATCFHAGSVLLAYVLVLAVYPGAPFLATVFLLLLSRLTLLLPFTPNGLGLQEASLALVLPSVGLSAEAALAVSFLSRLATLLTAVVGASIIVGARGDASARLTPEKIAESL